ncbi:MAG: LysM peptidoglycan-binding domain-containing protein [Verrucomicrobiota bacterium]|nr:LysM peptidoglycan-binding domain-containing protein [Verrucomicrobiota bacterium]
MGTRILSSFLLLFFFALGLGQSGCTGGKSPLPNETDDSYFKKGLELIREGRKDEALGCFQEVIDRREKGDAPEAHLEAGRIYMDQLKDSISAIYHFRKYLEVKPNSDKSALVRQLIETATKQFAATLPGQPAVGDPDRIDLMGRIEQLTSENLELRKQLGALGRNPAALRPSASSAAPAAPRDSAAVPTSAPTPPPRTTAPATTTRPATTTNHPPPRSYVVQSGDTLNKISLKVYGNPNRWNDIYQANRDQLASPHSLKVGQTLKIP